MPNLIEIDPVVLEKILKYVNVFSRLCYYVCFENNVALPLKKIKGNIRPNNQRMCCVVFH